MFGDCDVHSFSLLTVFIVGTLSHVQFIYLFFHLFLVHSLLGRWLILFCRFEFALACLSVSRLIPLMTHKKWKIENPDQRIFVFEFRISFQNSCINIWSCKVLEWHYIVVVVVQMVTVIGSFSMTKAVWGLCHIFVLLVLSYHVCIYYMAKRVFLSLLLLCGINK